MSTCRVCKGSRLSRFIDLGDQPHCNRFLTTEELYGSENFYPTVLHFCADCALIQMIEAVPAETMFRDHPYVSGTTTTLTRHFQGVATELMNRFKPPSGSLIVDIGSNDGTFLKGLASFPVRLLGVEPAAKIAKLAIDVGIPTVNEFFSNKVAAQIREQHGPAKIINAAGVFFHVDDLDDFVRGVKTLLADDGIFVVQAMYVVDMIERNSFDVIYHEHVCHYSLKPLEVLFKRFDMEIIDAERSPIHGGSIIVYAAHRGQFTRSQNPGRLIEEESRKGIHDLKTFERFAAKTADIKRDLLAILHKLKREGKRIAAYGAPAKGNTLLNYCKIGPDILEYATEKNRLKCGLYTPGMHIPVIPEEKAWLDPPEYYLMLAWNFLDEFLEKEQAYRSKGGKFIVPIPEPRII